MSKIGIIVSSRGRTWQWIWADSRRIRVYNKKSYDSFLILIFKQSITNSEFARYIPTLPRPRCWFQASERRRKRLKTTPAVKRRHHYTDSVFEWVANKLAWKVFPAKDQPLRLKHATSRKKHTLTKKCTTTCLLHCAINRRQFFPQTALKQLLER